MDRSLPAPDRPVTDDDAPPRSPSSSRSPGRVPSSRMHPVWRIVTGVVVGALTMFGVATLDTFAGASVPVLGSFAAMPAAEPAEPEVVEIPAPPSTPGTCLNWTRADAADFEVVDCAQEHLFEQAGPVALIDQIELPTDATWRQLVAERCGPVVETYLGNVVDPAGRYRVGALKPSAAKWEQGDRELRCGLQSASRSGALYPLVGRVADGDQSAVTEPGTCLANEGLTSVGDPIDCASPHAAETVGIVDLSGSFPDGFPAQEDQDTTLQAECNRIAAEYAGSAEVIAEKGLTVYWNNIREPSWAAGSYRTNCNLAALLPDRAGFAPITGSVLGDVTVGDTEAPPATSTPEAGVPAPPTTTPAPPSSEVPAPDGSAPPADGDAPPTDGETVPAPSEQPPVDPVVPLLGNG